MHPPSPHANAEFEGEDRTNSIAPVRPNVALLTVIRCHRDQAVIAEPLLATAIRILTFRSWLSVAFALRYPGRDRAKPDQHER